MENTPLKWKGAVSANGIITHGVGSDGTLDINCERMVIESKVGTFSFSPGDILDISPAGITPWLGAGFTIRHKRDDYPAGIGFCPRGISSKELIKVIADHGFLQRIEHPSS